MSDKIFVKNNSIYKIAPAAAIETMPVLPPKIFSVNVSMEGFFLKELSGFELPPKIYGSAERHADRMIQGFMNHKGSMGIHLDGQKGSGKTMLAKLIAAKMSETENKCPTLLINSALSGDGFNSFMQDIEQECVVIFDEFEKIFDADDQNRILTLLDGVYPQRKLFIITTNDDYKVSEFMKNRPSRVWYKMKFENLDYDFVSDYLDDALDNKDHKEGVLRLTRMAKEINFDMLQAIVKEMNDFKEPVADVLKYLNVKPYIAESSYEISLYNGKTSKVADSNYTIGHFDMEENSNVAFSFTSLNMNSDDQFNEKLEEILSEGFKKYQIEKKDNNSEEPILSEIEYRRTMIAAHRRDLVRENMSKFFGVENSKAIQYHNDDGSVSVSLTGIELNHEHVVGYDADNDAFVLKPHEFNEKYKTDISVVLTRKKTATVSRRYYDFL